MSERIPLLLLGGGGHCRACIDVIEAQDKYRIVGILDRPEKMGESVSGYTVIGTDGDLGGWSGQGVETLITVGQITDAAPRRKLFETVQAAGFRFAIVVSPRAIVSPRASLGEGTVVLHGAVINAGADIGRNVIINSLALIEHDVTIGDHVHIATRATVNGGSRVGKETFIGSGTVISQGASVAEGSVIGALSLVRHDVTEPGRYVGNPLRRLG